MHEETVFTYRKTNGDATTADHEGLSDENESRLQHRCAVVVKDLYSYWIECNPTKNKAAQETMKSLLKCSPLDQKPGVMHTDNSLDFIRACERLVLESRQINRISRNQRNCRTRSPWSERRCLCSSASVGSFRKVMERSDGMLLLFAKHTGDTGRENITVRKKIWNSF